MFRFLIALPLFLLAACGSEDPTAPESGQALCSEPGTAHAALSASNETWTRQASPHHVTAPLEMLSQAAPTLTIEPGATVCFGPGGSLSFTFGTLMAKGTADAPITFTAVDPAQPWGGLTIAFRGRGEFSHAVVEHAVVGIRGHNPVNIEHALIRQIRGVAISFWYYNADSHIRQTVVDSAALDGGPAVYLEAGSFERSVVRNSGGIGIQLRGRMFAPQVATCEVTGSAGDGILVDSRTLLVVAVHDCNLVSNGGVGVSNVSETVVNAQRNWWGAAGGPTVAGGDGVSGTVDHSGFLAAPVQGIGQ
jgi:hypothetical protein